MKTSCLFSRQFGHLPLILLLASGLPQHARADSSTNVVICEIMYHPPAAGTNDNVFDEFIELHNLSDSPALLFDPAHATNAWRLSGGVDFNFPPDTVIPPNGYLLVVSCDFLVNPAALAAFRSMYRLSADVVIAGPYRGQLDNGGESLVLEKPDEPIGNNLTYSPIDRVDYSDHAPWPAGADGDGMSLQRINHSLPGNNPGNWMAAAPTPGYVVQPQLVGDGSRTNVVLQFDGAANQSYTIEYTETLLPSANWLPLCGIGPLVTNTTISVTNQTSAGRQRFYRIVRP